MNRLDSLKEMLDFLNQDITELSEYMEDINEENDTDDIENAKYLISDVLYKYLRILNKI
jgi:hypothetical protein